MCIRDSVTSARTHRHAYVGLAQRWGIVHAVTGHRHDVPPVAEAARDAEFAGGSHPGDDRPLIAVEQPSECMVVLGKLLTVEHDATGPEQTDLPGDSRRRSLVVAGQHRHTDRGVAT